ncbi:hypothetical protein Tco_0581349, partial [Tanacetum coccineum]
GIKEATPDPLLKNAPVIVLSDEDSDLPATNKRRRLTKNGSIVNDNVHIISSSDDVVLPLSIKKTNQKKIVKNEKMESDDECPIRFSRNRNIKLQSSSKILTGSLIDEDTDEDIGKDNQADDESDNLFHDEAIVDSQVAGDEAVPHSNDSIDNEADDEYDYSDSFIDDGPIVDEPTS